MSLLKELSGFLAADSTVNSLTTKIYQTHLPQTYDWGATPAVSMNVISEEHHHNLSTSSGVASARVQIDCWSTDEDTVDQLAEAVRVTLQSYSGSIGTITCLGITLDNVVWLPEEPTDGSNVWRQHVAQDFLIHYRNQVAPA